MTPKSLYPFMNCKLALCEYFKMALDVNQESDTTIMDTIDTVVARNHGFVRRDQQISVGEYEVELDQDQFVGLTLIQWILLSTGILTFLIFCVCGFYCCIRCKVRQHQRRKTKESKLAKQQKNIPCNEKSQSLNDTQASKMSSVKVENKTANSVTPTQAPNDDNRIIVPGQIDSMQDINLHDDEENMQPKGIKGWFMMGNPFNNGKSMSLDF
jgi:hypothetical protein